jgi:hypothetical protein
MNEIASVTTGDLPNFQEVAMMTLTDGKVTVDVVAGDLSKSLETVYVWCTPSGQWLRVGSSCSRPLKDRLSDYAKHLNRALAGEEIKTTPRDYAEKWRGAGKNAPPALQGTQRS